ncbi:MAG: amidohydrolase family protein [Rhodothermales bacterium]
MKRALIFLLTSMALLGITPANAQDTGDILIKNGTVLTVTNGTLPNTDVLIRDGKIARVAAGLSAPRGVRVVDATGMYVMPGIIDAHSHNALSSINEGTAPVTSEVTMEDVIDPFDIGIYRALAGGVTTIHAMHGSANVIGGQCETLKLRYGLTNPDLLKMEGAPRTIKFALGENPTRNHGSEGIHPSSRMGVELVLRKAFDEAHRYMEAWDAYEKERITNLRAIPPAYNQRLEVIADIIRGDVLVQAHSYRADEIVMLVNVLRDNGVKKLNLQHANEAFKVAPELAEFGATASVFADWWAYKFEVYYSTAYNAAILTRNGVTTSINSDSGELIRHLYHEAAKTQRYGDLNDDEALALITINPAMQLGIANRVGSIEVGKDGDIALFNAHPLSVYAVPQLTIVDGIVRFDIENDPDDMRLTVDPDEPVEQTLLMTREDHDRDMEGVFDLYDFFAGENE